MRLTESIKQADVKPNWLVVDATDLPLGRLSSEVALRLRGKNKGFFTPHVDCGDNVIVINAEKVRLTGRKLITEKFFWHTGYPGGVRSKTHAEELGGEHPQRLVERSVKRMMPKTKLGRKAFGKLFVYAGSEHPHTAQKPQTLDMAKVIAKK